MSRHHTAMEILRMTSRTFYIPIVRLPLSLRKVVTSAHLYMRAVDEIEDNPILSRTSNIRLLKRISTLQAQTQSLSFSNLLDGLDINASLF
jgi:farnesyl-diphosphate farnesyltransferase